MTRHAVFLAINWAMKTATIQPFDAVIFCRQLVSLFYGEGDIVRTLQIGTLAGIDNPTAIGGLLGFMIGEEGESALLPKTIFPIPFDIECGVISQIICPTSSDITFQAMSKMVEVVDRVIIERINGSVDKQVDRWLIPLR